RRRFICHSSSVTYFSERPTGKAHWSRFGTSTRQEPKHHARCLGSCHVPCLLGTAADRGECFAADEAASHPDEQPVYRERGAGPALGGLAAGLGAESGAASFGDETEIHPDLHPARLVKGSECLLASRQLFGAGQELPRSRDDAGNELVSFACTEE